MSGSCWPRIFEILKGNDDFLLVASGVLQCWCCRIVLDTAVAGWGTAELAADKLRLGNSGLSGDKYEGNRLE